MTDEQVNELQPLYPQGTNSTFFTKCCRVAITDFEERCPRCKTLVVGWDRTSGPERHKYRWELTYRRA